VDQQNLKTNKSNNFSFLCLRRLVFYHTQIRRPRDYIVIPTDRKGVEESDHVDGDKISPCGFALVEMTGGYGPIIKLAMIL